MIVDLITNSIEVAEFVKEKYGGVFYESKENGRSMYRLVNIPIGYREYFNREILKFRDGRKIKSDLFFHEIR